MSHECNNFLATLSIVPEDTDKEVIKQVAIYLWQAA